MANYASVTVRIKAKEETLRLLLNELNRLKEQEKVEAGANVHFHLKYLLDNAEAGHRFDDVDGYVLDYRSYFTYYGIMNGELRIDLEQPWSFNLIRFQWWAKSYDENAEIIYYACEPMCDVYLTNDVQYANEHRRYDFVEIW